MSEPKGPVYLWARREVMEEEIPETLMSKPLDLARWPPIEPSGLSPSGIAFSFYFTLLWVLITQTSPLAATRIATALLTSHTPVIITSHLGRNPHALSPLLTLSTLLSIPIISSCPSTVNAPFSHPYFSGITFLSPNTHSPYLSKADIVLIIDSDIPFIPAHGEGNKPHPNARVFVLDGGDPLREGMGMWHVDAEIVCKASADVALRQIIESVRRVDSDGVNILGTRDIRERGRMLKEAHAEWVRVLDRAEDTFPSPSRAQTPSGSIYRETPPPPVGSCYTVPNIIGVLRRAIQTHTPSQGCETLILNESVSHYMDTWGHMRSEVAGSMISSGGASLGWALGACVGAVIGGNVVGADGEGTVGEGEGAEVGAVDEGGVEEGGKEEGETEKGGNGYELVVAIVGDGSFLFGCPSSVYWMARRYETVR